MRIIAIILMFSGLCFAQMRPLPAVLVASFTSDIDLGLQEPDIHNRLSECIPETCNLPEVGLNRELSMKLLDMEGKRTIAEMKLLSLECEFNAMKEQRNREKKIAGIAGILLFASGNETLKNVGLVSLFCYSIW